VEQELAAMRRLLFNVGAAVAQAMMSAMNGVMNTKNLQEKLVPHVKDKQRAMSVLTATTVDVKRPLALLATVLMAPLAPTACNARKMEHAWR